MPDTIGPHLLGRVVSGEDPRDYQLAHFLTGDPLDPALAAVMAQHHSAAFRTWATLITKRVETISPAPPAPQPVPPSNADVTWTDSDQVLDQGQTGHCVGFGWAGWGDTLPVDDKYTNADGDAIYYECKVIDGEPHQEDGSTVRSGAKAMKARKRLTAYAFAQTIDEVRAWLDSKGPVVFGTDWTNSMFTPDANGYVSPTDTVAGGHCYVCVGDLISEGALLFQNSWGSGWALSGKFKMTYADAGTLLGQSGEACAAVEIP